VADLAFTIIILPQQYFISEIAGSHGGEYEDDCLLECCAV
jgi:hypothetical protein